MSRMDSVNMKPFVPDDFDSCAPAWQNYKREFMIHLDSAGLHDSTGRRKVGQLLKSMGLDAIKIYDTFEWSAEIPAVPANPDAGTEAIPARPAEDKYDLDTVFKKFDAHFGVKNYRAMKRQYFLDLKRSKNQSVMDFVAVLKREAEFCEFGEMKESLICDKLINAVQDSRCSERLLELDDNEITLPRVIQICRQTEMTRAHMKTIEGADKQVHLASVGRGRSRSRGRGCGRSRGRGQQGGRGRSRESGYRQNDRQASGYCDRCCWHHERNQCRAYNKHCDTCGELGHFRRSPRCTQNRQDTNRAGGRNGFNRNRRGNGRGFHRNSVSSKNVYYADDDYDEYDECVDEVAEMFDDIKFDQVKAFVAEVESKDVTVAKTSEVNDEWIVNLEVQGNCLPLEIDTGAGCNIMSVSTLNALNVPHVVEESSTFVRGVHGDSRKSVGTVTLPCVYKNVKKHVVFQVFDGPKKLDLLGRSDSVYFGLVARVNSALPVKTCKQILAEFSDVVSDSIGCMPGKYTIKIDKSVQPVVHASRPVPAPLRAKVKRELAHLERNNIIEKISSPTPWVSSMVVARKKNSDRVRICIDPTDLNTAIMREHFPMNNFDDVVTRLAGSRVFSTLDANMGYFQMKLDEESSDLTTFNTPFGRYKYLRMPMGLKCASEVFQREMIRQFGEMEGVEVVVDDLLVHGKTEEEHNERLIKVLEKAREINLKLNRQKCKVGLPEVNYVGHLLTGEGMKPTAERVKAIVEMQDPTNVQELETLLGMIAYVSKFIPNLSELNAPLRELKKKEWKWGEEEKTALKEIKQALTSAPVLKYYDVNKPVTLSVDASKKGLGAAIIQENGVVAYASRTLTPTETRYAQIEKEMLAVVFGCTKFHKLIYGKEDVTIESDHKPLESLLRKPMHISPMRIQRMRLKLQPYTFNLVHIGGKSIGLADCLSRFPQQPDPEDEVMDDDLMVCVADTVTQNIHNRLKEQTEGDEELQELKKLILFGWPKNRRDAGAVGNLYHEYQGEISTYNGVMYRGDRVIVPRKMRPEMLKTLHSSHMGIVKTKQRARDLIFWPGMNKQIEEMVKKCPICLEFQNNPPKEPMIAHPIPRLPWNKVATDIFELEGDHYLVMVDYYSNFIEVSPLSDTRTTTVLRQVKANIARHGIMETLVSDNGPQYSSEEFRNAMEKYKINHVTSSPLYPQSNGLAERAVQTVKRLMKKCQAAGDDIYLALLDLNNTPRDDVLGSPAQRLMGRRTKTLIPTTEALLRPRNIKPETVKENLDCYKKQQKFYYDRNTRPRPSLKPGEAVRILTPRGWKPAEYIREAGTPRSHVLRAGDQAREYRRNRSHILATAEDPHVITRVPRHYIPPPQPPQSQQPEEAVEARTSPRADTTAVLRQKPPGVPQQQTTRYGRISRRPAYLQDYTP